MSVPLQVADMSSQAGNLRACENVVVVAGDDDGHNAGIVSCLRLHKIAACAASGPATLELIRKSHPRVVVCQPGATGLALFHALDEIGDPPVVVVLSEAPWARDEVHCDGRILVVVIRMPVQMNALATFIKTVLGTLARRRSARTTPASGIVAVSKPKSRAHLRVVH